MIAAILLAALSPLTCNLPSEFFAATNGTEAVLDIPVPTECVYDFASPSGKVLRVTPSVAAFYYSLISAYLERELLFGYAHGDLGGMGLTKSQAFDALKRDDLSMWDLDSLNWLNYATNRVVYGLGRFHEGVLTHDIVSEWIDSRMGRWAFYDSQGYITPRYFQGNNSARSIDFPELDYLEPTEIRNIVDGDKLYRTWVTWARLDDNPLRAQLSPPTRFLVDEMSRGCMLDDRPGSPAMLFSVAETQRFQRVGESFTNVVAKLAPGCSANLTNETPRLDYRRMVAISRLLSIDDRQIYPRPFGELSIDTSFDPVYTNFLDVTLTHECLVLVTNATLSTPAFNRDTGRIEVGASVSDIDMDVQSSSLVAVTNHAGLESVVAAANCGTAHESLGSPYGGANFEYVLDVERLKAVTLTAGTLYRFAAIFNAEASEDSVDFAMWHGSSDRPVTPDLTLSLGLEFFHATNTLLRVRRWKEQNHCWTLNPLRFVGEDARVPSPLTHDNEVECPDGSTTPYYSIYPKWLFEQDSLVHSLSLFFCGNVITLFDEQTLYPYYDPSLGPDRLPLSKAFYIHKPEDGLSYDDFFLSLWRDVEDARKFVVSKFTALAGSRPGEILGPDQSAAESVAETLSGNDWWGPASLTPFSVIPSEVVYDNGNFYTTATNAHELVRNVRIGFSVGPPAETTNTVGRAVSIKANLSYLAGFDPSFKNLAPSSLRSAAPP